MGAKSPKSLVQIYINKYILTALNVYVYSPPSKARFIMNIYSILVYCSNLDRDGDPF